MVWGMSKVLKAMGSVEDFTLKSHGGRSETCLHANRSHVPTAKEVGGITWWNFHQISLYLSQYRWDFLGFYHVGWYLHMQIWPQGSDQLYFSLHKIPGKLLRFRAIKLSAWCCPFLFSQCNATLICLSLSLEGWTLCGSRHCWHNNSVLGSAVVTSLMYLPKTEAFIKRQSN